MVLSQVTGNHLEDDVLVVLVTITTGNYLINLSQQLGLCWYTEAPPVRAFTLKQPPASSSKRLKFYFSVDIKQPDYL